MITVYNVTTKDFIYYNGYKECRDFFASIWPGQNWENASVEIVKQQVRTFAKYEELPCSVTDTLLVTEADHLIKWEE